MTIPPPSPWPAPFPFLALLAAFLLTAPAHASPGATNGASLPVAPILPIAFLGWTNAYRLHNDQAEAVLVPAIGRLVHFSTRQGPNILRLDPALHGQIPPEGDPFFNIGGDWLWPVAQARWEMLSDGAGDWPPPAPLDDRPWDCSAWTDTDGAPCARLSREYGAPLHIKVSRLFRLEPDSATLVVHQRIERTAPSEVPVVLWNISQVADTDQIALPVEEDSRFRGGLKVLMGRRPSRLLTDCGDVAVYRVAQGTETKLGSDSPRGWIAAAAGTNVIFESVVNPPGGDYPDGGCVVELFSNHAYGYSEIETLSPETPLLPGHILENTLRIQLAILEPPPEPCELATFLRALAGESVE